MGKIVRNNDGLVDVNSLLDTTQPPEDNNLVSVDSLIDSPEKKNDGLSPLLSGLNWVQDKLSSFNSALDAGAQKVSDWVVDKVKEQNGFDNNEDAIAFLNQHAQMEKSVDQYKGTLDGLNVKAPQEFFNQPYDKLVQWYDEQKNTINSQIQEINQRSSREGERKFGPEGEAQAFNMAYSKEDQALIDAKNKQLDDLEGIKDNLIATKLAALEDPKRIGLEYMRLFNPGQYQQITQQLQKVSPDFNDPKKVTSEIEAGTDEFLFKAFPQAFLYDNERQGLKILATAQVNRLKELSDPFQKLRLTTSETVKKLQQQYTSEKDPASKMQLLKAIDDVTAKYNNSPLTTEYQKNLNGLQDAVKGYWTADQKYPEVANSNFIKDWVEQNYNDQDVVSRQLLMQPGTPGVPQGAYGLFGRIAKSLVGTGKDALKSINAGLANVGLKDADRAYFQNYQLDQDWETLAYTPPEQEQQKVVGYDVPESVKQVAADIGFNPEAMAFMGTPKTQFNWGGVLGTMGDITGQVIGQALISRGTGAVFSQAVGDVAKGANLAGAGENVNKIASYLRRPEITQDRVGLFASTYATSYGQNYNMAIDAGLTDSDANKYALVSSMGSALTELINPESKMLRKAQGQITGKASLKEIAGILGDETLGNKDRILKFTGQWLKNSGISVAKETVEEVLDQVKQHVLDADYGINTTNMSVAEDAKQTAINTAIGMIPMAIVGGYGETHALRKEALYRAGTDPSIVQNYYDQKLNEATDPQAKEAVQQQYNTAMRITNTMAGIIKALPENNMQGRPLTLEEKADLAELIFKNRKLSEDAKSAQDEVLATPIQAEAATAQKTARDIVAGTNPAYIINGRSYSKNDFNSFLDTKEYKKGPENFKLEVYNDDATLAEVQKKTDVNGDPVANETETYLVSQQKDLQDAVIQSNQKIVELSESKPGSAELGDAEAQLSQNQKSLQLVEQRLKTVRQSKKEGVETPPASNNMSSGNPEANNASNINQSTENPVTVNNTPVVANNTGVPVSRSQGVSVKPDLTPAEQTESSKVGDVIKQKFEAAPKVISNHFFDRPLPNGETVKGRLALVPATAVTASHNPFSFTSSDGYPLLENGKNPNDRNYSLSENKAQVVSASTGYDARAVESFPTVTPDGVVIDGNQRTMSGQLAAANNTDEAYLNSLQQRLPLLGFTQEDYNYVAAQGKPRLVFLTEGVPKYNTQTFAAYNQQEKKEKSPMARAVELGRTVPDDVIARIGNQIEGFNTLSDFYADKKATNNVFDTLTQNGVLLENELPGYYSKESRTLTERGKEFLESLMLGKMVSEDNLNILNKDGIKNYRQKIVRAIRPLTEIESLGPEFSLKNMINNVISLKDRFEDYKTKSRSPAMGLDVFLSQRSMFGENIIDPETVVGFYNMEGTQKEFKDFTNSYLERARPAASGAVDMFATEPTSKQSILLNLSQRLQDEQQSIIQKATAISSQQHETNIAENNSGNAENNAGSGGVQQRSVNNPKPEGENITPPQQAEPVQPGGGQGSGIADNLSPQNNQDASQQRTEVQNQEVPPEGGQQQHSGINTGEQNQTPGQETQSGPDSGNSVLGGQAEVVGTATSQEEARKKAIELLSEQEKPAQLSLLEEFLKNIEYPAVTHINTEDPPNVINANLRSDLSSETQDAYQKRIEEMLDGVRAALTGVTRAKNGKIILNVQRTGDPTLDAVLKTIAGEQEVTARKANAFDTRQSYQKTKRALRSYLDAQRGAAWLQEKFNNAARNGFVSQEGADLAIDLIRTNPGLFQDLALSIVKNNTDNAQLQGYYSSADKIVKIFKDSFEATPTHELLHHTERFLPFDVRQKIGAEWYAQVKDQLDQARQELALTTDESAKQPIIDKISYLALAEQRGQETSYQKMQSIEGAMSKLLNKVDQQYYALYNPSEWWAVNAQRLFQELNNAPRKMTWMQKVGSWYRQLMKSVKNVFGLNPVRAVEQGLHAIMNGGTLETMKGTQLSATPFNASLSSAYLNQRTDDARQAVEMGLPAGIISFTDVLTSLKNSTGGTALMPYIAKAYKEVRDNPALVIAPSIKGAMTDDATIDSIAAKEVGSSDAEIASIGSMFMNRIMQKGQTIPDAIDEVNLLPVSRDKKTAILDYINNEIEKVNPATITVQAQRQKTWVQKTFAEAAKIAKDKFTVGGLIPETLRMLKEQEMGLRNEWTVKIKHISQDFNEAVKEEYKGKLTDQQRLSMDAALRGSAKDLAAQGPKVQAVIQNMRTFIDGLTQNLVKGGVIPAIDVARADLESAKQSNAAPEVIRALQLKFDLAKTVEDRMGTYINRQYEKHKSTSFSDKIKANPKVVQAATNYLYNIALINQGKQLAPEEIQQVIDTIVSHDDINVVLQSNAMNMDLSILKHMDDIPPQIRDLMGEIKDADWNFVNTTIKMSTLLERHHFLNNMLNVGKGTYFTVDDKADIATSKTEQISNKYWGPLAGKFTTPELAQALAEWGKTPGDQSLLMNALRATTSWAKTSKTALSWVSEIKNLLGNGVMLFQNGNFTPSEFKKGAKAIQDIMGNVKDPNARAFLERMARLNITNHNLPASEINNMSRELFNIVPDNVDWNPSLLKKVGQKITGFKTKAAEIYGATDDIFKIITFLNEREKLATAYKNSGVAKTDDELDKEASYVTTHIMPTFYKVPSIVRFVSQNIPLFGNFVSYPIELLRTTYNTVQLAAEQLRSQNPEIRKIGAKRMTWFLGTQVGTTILPSLIALLPGVLGMGGGDGDDRDAINELLPSYYKNNPNNIIKANDGSYYVHFMNSLDGQDWFKDIMLAAVRGEGFDKVTGPINEFLSPFVNQNMVVSKMLQWHDNADQYGKQIYNPEDTEADKALAFTKHFGDLAVPQSINDVSKTIGSFSDKNSEKGLLGILKLGTGQTVMNVDPKKVIGYRLKDFEFRIREAKKLQDIETRSEQVAKIRLERKEFMQKVASLRK